MPLESTNVPLLREILETKRKTETAHEFLLDYSPHIHVGFINGALPRHLETLRAYYLTVALAEEAACYACAVTRWGSMASAHLGQGIEEIDVDDNHVIARKICRTDLNRVLAPDALSAWLSSSQDVASEANGLSRGLVLTYPEYVLAFARFWCNIDRHLVLDNIPSARFNYLKQFTYQYAQRGLSLDLD